MDNRTKAILFLTIITLLLAGCAGEKVVVSKKKVTTQTIENTPEEALVQQVSDGKIVAVYDEYIRLGTGERAEDWLIIKNAKEMTETFTIYPCEGCIFESSSETIKPGQHRIVKFYVDASEGQKEIKVKDSLNNAYGYAKISVIIQ